MGKLLQRLPRHAGFWAPLLVLPLLLGEIWLHIQGHRPNPGSAWSLGLTMAVLGWYLLGVGLALARFREAWLRRRELATLTPEIMASDDADWVVDAAGRVLRQSPIAADLEGDRIGEGLSAILSGRLADAEGEIRRLLSHARRHGLAVHSLPGDERIVVERRAGNLLRVLLRGDERPVETPRETPLPDYDALPIAVLRLAPDGTVMRANRAALPYCGGDAAGLHVSKLLDGLGRSFSDWLAEARSARAPGPPEVLRAPRAGQDRFIQVSLHAEREGSDTLIAVLSDARALKTLEAQFVQSQKMQAIGQLAGGIAHDFNNLLTAISGHCDLLMLRHDKGDPDYADLDQISQNANRAANLVSHLLAFSRKQTLKPQTLDLRETIADLSHLLNRLVGDRIRLVVRHDPRLAAVRADRSKIEQVLMNLVVNARDAMPEGGQVDITTTNVVFDTEQQHGRFAVPAGNYVEVRIADQGCGIPPDLLGKIFEPFFTTKRVGEGTGLGLSTVYGIVKQTGGYIICDSTEDTGTVFTIYLPVHTGADEPSDTGAEPAGAVGLAVAAPPEGKVLLVEDEAPVRAFASRALKLRGYQVIEAASGEEALSMLSDEMLTVDLFVSDVVMPGLDGVSWVRRALADRPNTRVIFMSGYTEDVFEDGRNPIEGAAFLQKPFSLADLLAAVAAKLDEPA
ncbi:ATP-binding protein [Paracoccus sediminicola]|uniref:ATP-binding protein n=1 Tax=Paracoccus sediminicola TaxID=3017783 RepID=UPI0022F06BF4|nr:ATP-binding protein [Paracoccus sediminicola]WBU55499.1 ATP-binding protein [Paracoccus sediminicola]